jgi:hypothetical protein
MRNHNVRVRAVALIVSLHLTNCAITHAPMRWLPDPEDLPRDRYGAWVNIEAKDGRTSGELIAISEDTVFVATTTLQAIASRDVLSARLVRYNSGGWMEAAVILGTLSTLSNGAFLIFTAPMWLIGGSIAAANRSFDPIIDYPHRPLRDFTPYARFPQGLPPGVDQQLIKKKGDT